MIDDTDHEQMKKKEAELVRSDSGSMPSACANHVMAGRAPEAARGEAEWLVVLNVLCLS